MQKAGDEGVPREAYSRGGRVFGGQGLEGVPLDRSGTLPAQQDPLSGGEKNTYRYDL